MVDIPTRLRIEIALHHKRATDVARAAGVHPATLSRVLAGRQQPSQELIRRIEQAIRAEALA